MWSKVRVIISPSLPATSTILSKETWASPTILVLSKDNTGTGKGALGGRLTRTVLYDFGWKIQLVESQERL
jgi:hypothetical protein